MRKIFFTSVIFFLSALLFSCGDVISSDGSNDEDVDTGADLEDSEFVKNLGSNTTMVLEGVKGKTLLYVSYNNSSSTMSPRLMRHLTYAEGADTSNQSLYAITSAGMSANAFRSAESALPSLQSGQPFIKHFTPLQDFSKKIKSSAKSRAAASYIYDNASVVSSLKAGLTAKSLYTDKDTSLSSYGLSPVTLRAIGYANQSGAASTTVQTGYEPVCLVWVADENYSEDSSSQNKISSAVAEDIALKFAKHYFHERAVFGEEYDFLADSRGYTDTTASYAISDTGSLVNIVVYDIGSDFDSAPRDQCGVVGYFYAKDYFKTGSYSDVRRYTNQGKYFYLDAGFCNYTTSGTWDGNGNSASGTAISTLFHEFQHMIDFAQKSLYGVNSEQWFNEMLSMMCEDMMAEQLNIPEEDKVWNARLPLFNHSYYLSGIDEYLETDSVISYSTAYAFGAWLSREFGGPALISLISQNHVNGGMGAIRSAVKEMTGTSYSNRQLFKLFIQACVFRNDFAKLNSLPTFNKAAQNPIEAYGFTSKMDAVDLYKSDYGYSEGGSTYTGPIVLANTAIPVSYIRPHGFTIHKIGKAEEDTVTLTFSERQSQKEDIMVYIQNEFTNKE